MLDIIMIYFNRIYVRKKKSPKKKEYGASLKKNPRKVDEEQIRKGFIRLYIIHTCMNIKTIPDGPANFLSRNKMGMHQSWAPPGTYDVKEVA